MDLNRAELTCCRTIFPTPVPASKMQRFPTVTLCLTYIRGLILELGRDLPIAGQ